MPKLMIKIALVDDHGIVLDGLQSMLSVEPELNVLGAYQSGAALREALQNGTIPDVLFLDIHLPDANGVELCKKLVADYPDLKIIGLSMVNQASLIKLMLKNGACGYLHKNAGKEEMLTAIQQVYEGDRYLSKEISELLFSGGRGEKANANVSPFPRLSRREKDVLKLIVAEKTTQEIADQLFISFGTVETHRRNILSKLGARNTAGLVRIAIEYDLV